MSRFSSLATIVLILLAPVLVQIPTGALGLEGQLYPQLALLDPSSSPFNSSTPTGLVPVQVRHAYGLDRLGCSLTGTWGISNLCGVGQRIAIVDAFDDPAIESDLARFDSQLGLPACTTTNGCFVKATPQGQPKTVTPSSTSSIRGWGVEISLDVEWAHAIAPGAAILLVEAIDNSVANLFAAVVYASQQPGVHQVSMSFGAPETSWGTDGFPPETGFDSLFQVSGVTFFASSGDSGGLAQWYPAASPNVIGVGGTTLNVDAAGNVLNETAWSGSGGGISPVESEPPYQLNFGVSSGGKRGVPDVSYVADPSTGVSIFDSIGFEGFYSWFTIGGTSAGSPQWAAITAIVNSMRNTPLSSPSFGTSTIIYGVAMKAYSTNFRDITVGSNGKCGSICRAGVGYDFVTGLGSPLANNLVPTMAKTKP